MFRGTSRLRVALGAKRARWIIAIGGIALVAAGARSMWGTPRALAIQVRDLMGLRLVEGHSELIAAAARESRVDPLLVAAVMYVESHGRGGQTSTAGALGLMQLVPGAAMDAARRLGIGEPLLEEVLDDDALNVRLGAAHLAWLLEHRGDWSAEEVLVSYNAGRARLFGWIERDGSYAAWRTDEIEREERGEGTGALRYALEVLAARETFLERGAIRPIPGIPPFE